MHTWPVYSMKSAAAGLLSGPDNSSLSCTCCLLFMSAV